MAIEKILKDDASEENKEMARMALFVGAIAITILVKTTLGPKGMDKILQSTGRGREVTVTNDGATILKSLPIDNPAAKVLIDISKIQDDEVGDGTASVVVLAGELLREAEKLVAAKIHPMTIISGYRMTAECARNALLQRDVDNKGNAENFKSDLMKITMTTLSSKILSQDKEHFAQLAVDAIMRLKGSTNLEAIQIIKKPGGSLKDSFLDEGFILDKKIGLEQSKRIENAKILVANTAMDTDKVKIYGARVRVDLMSKVAEIKGAEKEKMREKVQKIIAHGINCFVNRQLIYNFSEELFADAGILAIEHADFDGIERLALVTGGEIASTFDNLQSVKKKKSKRYDNRVCKGNQSLTASSLAFSRVGGNRSRKEIKGEESITTSNFMTSIIVHFYMTALLSLTYALPLPIAWINATIYRIWRERNDRLYGQQLLFAATFKRINADTISWKLGLGSSIKHIARDQDDDVLTKVLSFRIEWMIRQMKVKPKVNNIIMSRSLKGCF
ncbi:T-complex protein 1 subunit beta-like [Durio zibethinus]|uniref:CCT-beta n=1 Tax=Durio zibethinus TaxID=66656 RepID=A0A6P6AYR3_DURZI|nr:T-complex protein 1 subunit beta-like [Durio zibethinus]